MSLDEEFIESLARGDHIRYSIREDNPNISDEEAERLVAQIKEISASYPIKDNEG